MWRETELTDDVTLPVYIRV